MKDHYIPESRFPLEIAPGIRVLGNYFFNLFLVTGTEKSLLFETGISGVVDAVIQQLDHLGISPDFLVVSHPHSDHATGLPGLMDRFPGARVLAGKGAKEFLSHPKAGPALVREDRFMSQGLEKMGIMPGRPSLSRVPDLEPVIQIHEKTRLDLGGQTFLDLIPVKGHSPGNLVGLVPGHRALFCSDSMGFHYPGREFWPLFFTGVSDYLETMDLIAGYDPLILCPAHQGPIKGKNVPGAIDQSRAQAEKIIHLIKETKSGDTDRLVSLLFNRSYRDEFTLYTRENILNCTRLLVKRAREYSNLAYP